ncbi:MAG: type I secretion system permease/ATPase [Salaquimonas sp.]
MDKLQSAIADFKRLLWVIAFFSLFTNLLMLAIPLYMLQIYDRVLPSQSSATLTFLSIIALLALLVLGGMETVRSILANRTAARLDAHLGASVLQQVIRAGSATGGSSQPMRDLNAIRTIISSRQAFAVLDLPFASIFIVLLYFIHPHLFWITLAGALVLVLIAWFNQYLSSKPTHEQSEKSIRSALQTEYLARNADSLVAMGMVRNVVNNWGNSHSSAMMSGDDAGKVNAMFTGFSKFVRLLLQIIILGYGALLVLDGEMTPGMIFASSIISGRALAPIDQVIGSWRQVTGGLDSWQRLKDFLAVTKPQESYMSLPRPLGALEVQDILQPNALDPAARPVLARVSFKLNPGESVAVIGPSGSGKSTLARIIIGAVTPRAGIVRIDGHDINNWDPEVIGKYIGYLAQDVDLLPGTIAQNISRFEPNPEPEKIIEAARLAHVEGLIKAMPKGYDTPIGPGGAQISGGEKQRIGLARAFYGNPQLLVLDEPNSSLDRFGEIALNKALSSAKANKISVFIITQRETALALVDKIMRVQAGQIVDFGDKTEIINKYSAKPDANKKPPNPPGSVNNGGQ